MNLKLKITILFTIFFGLLLTFNSFAYAQTTPDFPSCSNPQSTLVISYNDGTHGIVGDTATYTGSDAVYQLDENNYSQCFCSNDGTGIQTNWWKVGSLDQDQIDTLKKLGWVYVPDGSAWGLAQGAYMAKNSSYSCGGGNTPKNPSDPGAPQCTAEKPATPQLLSVSKNGTSATITWTAVDKATHYVIAYGTQIGIYPYGVPNTGNVTNYTINALDPTKTYYFEVYAVNDCMPSDSSTNVNSTGTGQVLGLATTGNALAIVETMLASLSLLASGLLLKKSDQN